MNSLKNKNYCGGRVRVSVSVSPRLISYLTGFRHYTLYISKIVFDQFFQFSVEFDFMIENPASKPLVHRRLVGGSELQSADARTDFLLGEFGERGPDACLIYIS